MKLTVLNAKWLCAVALLISIAACSENADVARTASVTPSETPIEKVALDVYKSPTCGCCEKWVDHVEANGFHTEIHHPDAAGLNGVKLNNGVAAHYQSCHTAISADGYVFEGHIPAPAIKRFLLEKPPSAIGLAVPGMPVGSPGMEMGKRRDAYDVLLLKKDGSSEVYERMGTDL